MEIDTRTRFAYHQAGHALVLLFREIPFREVALPAELPDDVTSLPLEVNWDTEELKEQRRFDLAAAGLAAEIALSGKGGSSADALVFGEFAHHVLEGIELVWNLNLANAKEYTRCLMRDNRELLDAVAAGLQSKGKLSRCDLLELKSQFSGCH